MPRPLIKRTSAVPAAWRRDIARVVVTRAQIASRVRELARDINRDFAGHDTVVVGILHGAVLFLADLLRHLDLPLRLDFAERYRNVPFIGILHTGILHPGDPA